MASDIILGGALRSTLLSNIRTERSLAQTTLQLATGLSVNSALDNPQNFFAAQSLNNRSNDLQRLLDGIGQSVRTIEAADAGIASLSRLVEQSESLAQQAVELNRSAETQARTLGDTDLRAAADLTQIDGINNGDTLILNVRNEEETTLFPTGQSVTINTGDNIDQLVADINSLNNLDVRARVDMNGALELSTSDGNLLNVQFDSANGAGGDSTFADALGFSNQARTLISGFGAPTPEVQFTVTSGRGIESFELTNAITQQTAQRSDTISGLQGPEGAFLFFGLDGADDTFSFGVNGADPEVITIDANQTIQGLIDQVNNSSLGNSLEADFNEETGQITLNAIDENVRSIQTALSSNGVAVSFFGFNVTSPLVFGGSTDEDSIELGTAAGPSAQQIAQLENDFDTVRTQIDNITEDARFRGINLLRGEDLVTTFNEDRDNTLTTEGQDLTASGLGLEDADFTSISGAISGVNDARAALERVRGFGTSIANDLAIIQTRDDFTENTINTLLAGRDDLTVADQNEAGANLLALQTRQALGVTALSFAAQSQQSVLSLF